MLDIQSSRMSARSVSLPTMECIMSDTPTQELIDDLRRSIRRWKALALTLLAGLGLVVVFGTWTTTVLTLRARQQAEAARQAEMEAREQAEQARDEADAARRDAGRANGLAQERLWLARQVVEELFTRAA